MSKLNTLALGLIMLSSVNLYASDNGDEPETRIVRNSESYIPSDGLRRRGGPSATAAIIMGSRDKLTRHSGSPLLVGDPIPEATVVKNTVALSAPAASDSSPETLELQFKKAVSLVRKANKNVQDFETSNYYYHSAYAILCQTGNAGHSGSKHVAGLLYNEGLVDGAQPPPV